MLCLWSCLQFVFATGGGERCVNMDSKSVRRLKLSRFPWFLGWAQFQSTCHRGLSRNLWSKLGPGMCRITVTATCSGFCPAEMCCVTRVNWLTTPKTGNEIRHSRQPPSGQPNIWGSSLACSWTWLMETNFGRVIMIRNKCSLIWYYSSGQQLQNERSLSRYSGLLIFKLSVSLSVAVCGEHIVIVAWTLALCCVNIITALLT